MKELFLRLRMVYATVIIRPKVYHAYTTINISSTDERFQKSRLLRFREENKGNIFG